MNLYALVILLTLAVAFVIDTLAEVLNLKAMKDRIPEEMQGVYDETSYATSQAYTRERTRFGFISSVVGLTTLLAFWWLGGFNALDLWVRSFGWSPIATGLAFIGTLMLLQSALSLPFQVYSTFVIEQAYGFNKTTPATFVSDLMKGLGLGILLGAPILGGVLWFFDSVGSYAWLWVWGMITVFSLLMQYIAPVWIMPLFNRFTPLQDQVLRDRILAYSQKVGFPLREITVMDGSRRSSKSNAFFTGFGRNKRIALFDTLIEKHTHEELVAVVAHEVGHYKLHHIRKSMLLGVVHTGFVLWLLSLFLTQKGLFEAFGMQNMSVYAGLVFFGMLYQPVEEMLSVVMNWMSRVHEFQADRFARETTGDAEAMIQALKKLSKDNLSNLTPHPFYVRLNYSHPPVLERIRALRE